VDSEALVNGRPAIVSDRGGLPEEIQQGGQVLPLPNNLTPASALPVDASVIERWLKAIEQFADDEMSDTQDNLDQDAVSLVIDDLRPDFGGSIRHGDPATFSPKVWR